MALGEFGQALLIEWNDMTRSVVALYVHVGRSYRTNDTRFSVSYIHRGVVGTVTYLQSMICHEHAGAENRRGRIQCDFSIVKTNRQRHSDDLTHELHFYKHDPNVSVTSINRGQSPVVEPVWTFRVEE